MGAYLLEFKVASQTHQYRVGESLFIYKLTKKNSNFISSHVCSITSNWFGMSHTKLAIMAYRMLVAATRALNSRIKKRVFLLTFAQLTKHQPPLCSKADRPF